MDRQLLARVFVTGTMLAAAAPVLAQPATPPQATTQAAASTAPVKPVVPRWARVSFFAHGAVTSPVGGESSSFTELTTGVSTQSAQREASGFEYGLDARFGTYPSSEDRQARVSVYDAYVARRSMDGRLMVKGGQMWINDLGGVGSLAGGLVELRQAAPDHGLRWRLGGFFGVEPEIMRAGYVPGIRKAGGYVAFDGGGARKHVVGYVNLRNQSLTERSVVTFTNYVPVRQSFFLYQAAEVDVTGPGGQGNGGLTYFFANARVAPAPRADVQLTFHHGRSVDARTITDDILNGRPVSAKQLEGYLYESVNGRVTIEIVKNVRAFVGYGRDRNGSADPATARLTFGASSSNLLGSGIDLYVTDYRYDRGSESSYDSWYVSVGRSLGSKAYVSGEFSSSLSVLRFTQSSGIVIETRPTTKRFGGSIIVAATKAMSVQVTGEHTAGDGYRENRVLAGVVYRF